MSTNSEAGTIEASGLLWSDKDTVLDLNFAIQWAAANGIKIDEVRRRLELCATFSKASAVCHILIKIDLPSENFYLPSGHKLQSDYVLDRGKLIALNASDYEFLGGILGESNWVSCTIADMMLLAKKCSESGIPFETRIDQNPVPISQHPSKLNSPKLLPEINLFDYQSSGVDWIFSRATQGMGALLADEMGLGKTVQAIAWISAVASVNLPILIIAPAALTENWRRELLKFAGVSSTLYEGSVRSLTPSALSNLGVLIATYDSARINQLVLQHVNWHTIVLDEAQYIKNHESARTQAVKSLNRVVGIALTGTPVENRVEELISILDFVVPGGLDDLVRRKSPIDAFSIDTRIRPLLPSLMLRREVSEVAQDLPDRLDFHLPLVPTENYLVEQQALVDSLSSANDFGQRLAVITKLRQLSSQEEVESSPKFNFLSDVIENAKVSGSKILIFANYKEAIHKISRFMRSRQVWSKEITGAITGSERQSLIDEFSALDGTACLVLNPKAGGVGLNITAANVVIHFEPDWNPALIDQATARAFRRGQRSKVFVYYLSYVGTVEEYIEGVVEGKRVVAADIIAPTEVSLDSQEIERILRWLNKSKETDESN